MQKFSFSEEEKDNLRRAIVSGTLEVVYSDKKVRYRSLDDMIRILAIVEARNSSNSAAKVASFSKGI